MIISKTPFRMSFFGGGTDYIEFYEENGGSVISTTFDKYCYVTVRHLPPFFDYSSELSYSDIERIKNIEEIRHPVIREAMRYLDMKEIRLTYEADLPARSGLGTSSSFAVGILNAFYALKGKYVDKKRLADNAILLERSLCKEAGGIQDQIAVSYGGFNRIDFVKSGYSVKPLIISEKRKTLFNENLMLFFTGFSRKSYIVAEKQRGNIHNKNKELLEIFQLVDEAENIFTSDTNIDEIGKLLDYTWKLKRSILEEISTNSIDEIYKTALKAGAIGGKILGAGGGGFLLFYVPKEKQKNVKDVLKNLLYVPFKFESFGTSILYYQPEELNI